MIKRILEVGVAVANIESAGKPFIELLGAEKGKLYPVDQFNMNMRMFRVGNVEFELMESTQTEGLIDRYVRRKGEGLHHIAFEVEDINHAMRWCKSQHIEIIEDKAYEVYDIKAVFLHPKVFGGVLFELIEGNPKWVSDRPLPDTLQEEADRMGTGAQGIVEVGILVNNLETLTEVYPRAFGVDQPEINVFRELSIKSSSLKIGNIVLQLIETISEENYLAQWIDTNRTGLCYITIKVKDLEHYLKYISCKGVDVIEQEHSPFWEDRTAFLLTNSLCNIPVRLTEITPLCL